MKLDAESSSRASTDLAALAQLLEQLGSVRNGRRQFHEYYLRDTFWMSYWDRASTALSQMLDADNNDPINHRLSDSLKTLFRILEDALHPLPDNICLAAKHGVLGGEDRAGIRSRLLKVDELFDMYHRKTGTVRSMVRW